MLGDEGERCALHDRIVLACWGDVGALTERWVRRGVTEPEPVRIRPGLYNRMLLKDEGK
jgi:hypothetical protein